MTERGTVTQLPSGAWFWRVSTGAKLLQPDGTVKRERVTGTAPSAKAARAAIRRVFDEAGERREARLDPTVAEWVTVWLHECEHVRRLTPSTLAGYRLKASKWIVPLLGDVKVRQVTPRHIVRMMDQMTVDGELRSKATRNQVRNLVSGLLRSAQEHGITDSQNPARIARPPVGDRAKKHHTPTPAEVRHALDVARDTEGAVAHLMVRLAVMTGARRGSLAALRWTDLDDGRLHVGRSTTVLPGVHVEGPTKTGQTVDIPLDADTLTLLVEHRARLTAVDGTAPTWIIADDPGAAWLPHRLTKTWERIREAAGLPDTRLHDLRHFVGTVGAATGDYATAGERLTHADGGATTLRVYAHGTETGQVELTRILAEQLSPSYNANGGNVAPSVGDATELG
jgi:integrase